jgi:hypothetical protein
MYTCSYMFQSMWTIFREPTLVLAKVTLFNVLPLKCSVQRIFSAVVQAVCVSSAVWSETYFL